ncbi:hypothetical protein FEM48_Zijuj11G0125000 [Ziziphus jujuba var. spinosa]|uniref:Protein kinase domain-containing protein n=1 Tax=Ziziphus jujuba var. spinosa TaxID=714518 RepID=A0A978UIY2_ZIZJJ|nr:hypothetical protein FEM48_Zijuj11G0125000 [Ziziphus jujuba var. spinosa]
MFEAKVVDFGLAKFTPEGMTHLSTRVAGTMGYVAPEYALYGQLTETSDVYSFGVVLLELLMRDGRALDVIEDDMPDKSPPQVLEKYVLVVILCSHLQLYARPTMDQAVKMLETDMSIPSTPERPIPLVAKLSDIERSVSTSGLGTLVSRRGYSSYTYESDRSLELKEERRTLGSLVEELSQ